MKNFFRFFIVGNFAVLGLLFVFLFVPTSIKAESYANMSCGDLWYARNAIFAREGQCFSTPRAIRTFGRRCYAPYGRLNKWEEDEVNTIKYWESRKGCNGGYASRPVSTYRSGSSYARVSGVRWNDVLAVRSGPSTRYARIGNLAPNATGIEILECTRRWCRIRYGNLIGWSYAKYLRSY